MRKQVRAGFVVVILGVMLAAGPAAAEVKSYFTFKGGYFGPTGKVENQSMMIS